MRWFISDIAMPLLERGLFRSGLDLTSDVVSLDSSSDSSLCVSLVLLLVADLDPSSWIGSSFGILVGIACFCSSELSADCSTTSFSSYMISSSDSDTCSSFFSFSISIVLYFLFFSFLFFFLSSSFFFLFCWSFRLARTFAFSF